jgi:predicted RNA-binding protein
VVEDEERPVNYWIISLPRPDMEHCIQIGTFGLSRKYLIGNVQPDDKVACYVTKENKIIALGKATSHYYMDDRKIFKGDGLFPDRFDFKATLLGPKAEIDFKSMVDDLSFITNKMYWTVYLRSGVAKIPEKDWRIIESRVGAAV